MLDKKENGTIRFAGNQNPIATFNTMRIPIGMQPHPRIDASLNKSHIPNIEQSKLNEPYPIIQ